MPGRRGAMIEASIHVGVPDAARRLIWDVFFAQARRGVDFDAHLPWADAPDTRSVTIKTDKIDKTVAALVIRPARQPGVAMVGFVCVDSLARGQGHAAALMARAHAAIDEAGTAATVLWTGKPQVYAGSGYRTLDRDRFLTISALAPVPLSPIRRQAWPDVGGIVGLPAFATAGERLSSKHAAAVIVHSHDGVTLADWRGEPGAVAGLMHAAGHMRWSINLPQQSGFDKALNPALFTIEVRNGAFAMVRCADPSFALDPVPLVDRI